MTGGWIFNTEAHPLDPGIVYCCSKKHQSDTALLQQFEQDIDFIKLMDSNFEDLEDEEGWTEEPINEHTNQTDEIAAYFDLVTAHHKGNVMKDLVTIEEDKDNFMPKKDLKKFDNRRMNLNAKMLNQLIQELERDLAEQMATNGGEMPRIREIICERCCTFADGPRLRKASLTFWQLIYSNYFHFVPLFAYQCQQKEKGGVREITTHYFRDTPDAAILPSELQHLDAIKRFSFQKSTWTRHRNQPMDEEDDFALLTTQSQPFDHNFMGIGQIVGIRH